MPTELVSPVAHDFKNAFTARCRGRGLRDLVVSSTSIFFFQPLTLGAVSAGAGGGVHIGSRTDIANKTKRMGDLPYDHLKLEPKLLRI